MSIDNLINRLSKVKRTGNGQYIACCPAHDDKSPSMTIREVDDGRILLHCFGGCDTESILGALGLEFSDLFPEPLLHRAKPLKRPFNAFDVLACVRFESRLTALASFNIANGIPMTEEDKARLLVAAQRLNEAAELAGVE